MLGPPGLGWLSSFASDFQWCCLADRGSPSVVRHIMSVGSSSLLLRGCLAWFVCWPKGFVGGLGVVMRAGRSAKCLYHIGCGG